MNRHQVSLWNSVPAFAVMLADQMDATAPAALPPLRWMILAGDWIPVSLPDRVKSRWPHLDFIASGGPTETTIWDIWNRIERTDPSWRSVPYGRPLANTEYFVLDPEGNPCPVWVKGEIHIAGKGVARGYLNAAEATEAKFLDQHALGRRLYRSGDMGRYLPDGSIEFLGRNDFQVKINGQRIELGEIEKLAMKHPCVHQAIALVHRGPSGPRLRLFVATGAQAHTDGKDQVIDQQEAEFAAQDLALKNPIERLLHKLEYRSQMPQGSGQLIGLPAAAPIGERPTSHRRFEADEVSLEALAAFLSPLAGARDPKSGEAKFHYGSAGGIYPVQVFLHLREGSVSGMAEGLYRFYPLNGALELISAGPLSPDVHWSYNRVTAKSAPWTVFLVGDLDVIRAQYGRKAESMAYLEAGMMSQLLRSAASITGFGVCQIGDLALDSLEQRLGLSELKPLLTTMVAGKLPARVEPPPDERSWKDLLQAHLALYLPPHMMPSAMVVLPVLPLTANGKVDRQALLALPTDGSGSDGSGYLQPSGGFEECAAAVMAQALGVAQVSATANFFDLGASSALLARVHGSIQSETGTTFPLIHLFRFPTLRSLAANVIKGDGSPSIPGSTDSRASKQKAALARLRKSGRSSR
jgi:epothilone synthetase B